MDKRIQNALLILASLALPFAAMIFVYGLVEFGCWLSGWDTEKVPRFIFVTFAAIFGCGGGLFLVVEKWRH